MKRIMLKSLIIFFIILVTVFILYHDMISYLLHVGGGQADLLFKGRPIEELLKNKDINPELKQKFLLVSEIKNFAEEQLGLKPTSNYTKYYETKNKAIVYVLSAAPADKMETYVWKFPVMGGFPYKGYFDKNLALEEEQKMKAKGYDTYVRDVIAYSTLGILRDPLISTMLQYDTYQIANVIIHESTHATIFIKDKVEFNENLASFVGYQGALEFLRHKYGPGSDYEKHAVNVNADGKIFAAYINYLSSKLEEIYNRNSSSEDKLKQKAELFIKEKANYKKNWVPKYKSRFYTMFASMKWNNALILAYKCYYQDLDSFYKIFKENKSDLRATINYFVKKKN